jgi:hypothetical protein
MAPVRAPIEMKRVLSDENPGLFLTRIAMKLRPIAVPPVA